MDKKTGRARRYFRRAGRRLVLLPGEPGSAEFKYAYRQALAGGMSPKSIAMTKPKPIGEAIYFAQVGGAIKIGFTASGVEGRLASFRTATTRVRLLGVFPGDRRLEGELHRLFGESRIRNELFRPDATVREFISIAKRETIDAAVAWLRKLVLGSTSYEQVLAERFKARAKRNPALRGSIPRA
jgi:hypothetical protein